MKIHIGKIIESEFIKSGMKISHFAKMINTVPRNAYQIFEREEVKTGQLTIISEVLNHNFFQYYHHALSAYTNNHVEPPKILTSTEKKKKTLLVTIELDGTKEGVDNWINVIQEINKILGDK